MKIKKSALIQIAILILFVGIIEPTSFIGTWIHSLCGALRTMAFLVSVLLYLKDRISKGWSGKAMVSYSYTKDWNWAHLTGPARKKKHWRSHRSSTSISCRDLKLLHAIRSRKSDRGKSYKVLCKTEKIKKYLPVIISSEKKLSTFHDPLSSFIKEYFQAIYGACG